MLLKRDTDFALRILYCLKQSSEKNEDGESGWLSLTEIAVQTGVPKRSAARICDLLSDRGMIRPGYARERPEKAYCASEKLLLFSLLDVVETTEGTGQIFALFNRSTTMYETCGERIGRIQKNTENVLAEATLKSLFK